VVVFQVHVADFVLRRDVDSERQTPVAGYAEAPRSVAVAGQCVHPLRRQGTQFLRVLHVIQKREHLAELVGCIGRNALCAVLRIELLQSLVSEVPDLHNSTVACSLTLVNPKMSKRRIFWADAASRVPYFFFRSSISRFNFE